MQNKPNFQNAQMNINLYITKDYENKRLCRRGENKPKQTQFKTRTEFISGVKMLVLARQLGYRNNIIIAVQAAIHVFMLNLTTHKLIREIENDVTNHSIC